MGQKGQNGLLSLYGNIYRIQLEVKIQESSKFSNYSML